MRWIDGHLDLAYLAVNGRDIRHPLAEGANGCVTLPALRAANVELALATIFTEPGVPKEPYGYASSDDRNAAEAAGLRQIDVYERLEREDELSIVRGPADLYSMQDFSLNPAKRSPSAVQDFSHNPAKVALPRIVILMEGADPIRAPEDVPRWKERGVRMVGLTWATGSRYAGGNSSEGPMTPLGRELVAALDEAGIVHDASHLSDAAFETLLDIARGPIVATHSNCRALLEPRQRHLRDDQIAAIGARDGIVGLNLYSKFLAVGRRATIADCVAHVSHVADVMGHRRGVALGSDMDGGFGRDALPEGLDHPAKLAALADALRDAGWSDDEVAGFAFDNWRRFVLQKMFHR